MRRLGKNKDCYEDQLKRTVMCVSVEEEVDLGWRRTYEELQLYHDTE